MDDDVHTRKILFVTNAESGQANTILAMALEALTRPDVEVHIASFPVLRKRVEGLSPKLKFHALDGKDMLQAMASHPHGLVEANLSHPPTHKSFAPYGRTLGLVLTVWDGETYMRIYDSVVKVIEELNPALVVVDNLLNAGVDACHSLNQKFVLNSPNCATDVARTYQPWLKGFWRYPMPGTGLKFPISWRDLPTNIMACVVFMYRVFTSPEVTKLVKYRNAHGLSGWLPMEAPYTRKVHIICPSVRELDFPLVVPPNLGLYGPIVLDTSPIEVADPDMNRWLDGGETVMMCMGTHFQYTESQVKAVIDGFLSAVGQDSNSNSNTQFLWKLSNKAKFEHVIEESLKHQKDKQRFKIVDWLDADPISIMRHPNVIAYVHHGGANSYYEAALAGIPQIILAQWYDLYDIAVRAEYRGIGIYANKKFAPDIETVEFGTALARLVRPGEESEGFRKRAKVVAEVCRDARGKKAAVDKLLEIVEGEEDALNSNKSG